MTETRNAPAIAVASALVRSLTAVALFVFFLATYVRWVGPSGENLDEAVDGIDGLGRQLLAAPIWYTVLSGSRLWPGAEQWARDGLLILGLLVVSWSVRSVRLTIAGGSIQLSSLPLWIATHVATLVFALVVASASLWLLSGRTRLYAPEQVADGSKQTHDTDADHGRSPVESPPDSTAVSSPKEEMTVQDIAVRHAFRKSVRDAIEDIVREAPNERQGATIVAQFMDNDRPEDRALLLLSAVYGNGYGTRELTSGWHQALVLACHTPNIGGEYGDLVDVDARRLYPSLGDQGIRDLAERVAAGLLFGANEFIGAERRRRHDEESKALVTETPEIEGYKRIIAERRARGLAEVRGRLSEDARADFDAFLTSPFSVAERSQCRIREDLLRLTVLWNGQLSANTADKEPELREGLQDIAATLLDFLRYDRKSVPMR